MCTYTFITRYAFSQVPVSRVIICLEVVIKDSKKVENWIHKRVSGALSKEETPVTLSKKYWKWIETEWAARVYCSLNAPSRYDQYDRREFTIKK